MPSRYKLKMPAISHQVFIIILFDIVQAKVNLGLLKETVLENGNCTLFFLDKGNVSGTQQTYRPRYRLFLSCAFETTSLATDYFGPKFFEDQISLQMSNFDFSVSPHAMVTFLTVLAAYYDVVATSPLLHFHNTLEGMSRKPMCLILLTMHGPNLNLPNNIFPESLDIVGAKALNISISNIVYLGVR